jgi:dolichol kinase
VALTAEERTFTTRKEEYKEEEKENSLLHIVAVMSTKLPSNRGSDSALKSVSKGALATQVSAITLHQLSRALSLSQKNKNKNNRVEVQYVTLLSFYSLSLSMNSTWSKPSIHLLCSELIRKGKTGDAVATICFILSLASRKFIDGNQKSRTGEKTF